MKTVAAAFLALCSQFAAAEPIQLKGISPLQTAVDACAGANLKDLQATVDALGTVKIPYPASECEADIGSLAGLVTSQKARLLFWDGRLAKMVVRFDSLSLEQAANLRSALIRAFGKSSFRRNTPFTTDTWRQGASQLELELTWLDSDTARAGVHMSHQPSWNKYLDSTMRIDNAQKAALEKSRANDVR